MRFKTIALQKWLNKNRLHPWKHVSHPWEQFQFITYQRFDRFETPCFCIRFFTEIEVCGFHKVSNAIVTETLLVSSVWVTPGRTIWQLSFWNKYHWLHVQRRLLSYQICSTITSQIIPRHLIAGPAECAQRWNPPPPNGRAGRAKSFDSHWATSLMASSRFPAWDLGPHLFFSSPGVRSLRRAGPQRAWKYCFFAIWSIFRPSKKWLEFWLEKIGPKMQKSWIWGSPNPPKTDPKSFLNRDRQKVMIFH